MIGPPCKHGDYYTAKRIFMQQESILHNRPNVPIRLEEYRSFFSAISIGLSRISFPWNQCSQRPLWILFLKRRMAAYFSSFRMNLQRMPSRHETTYPHSSQIVYLRLWGYASPLRYTAQSQAKCLLSGSIINVGVRKYSFPHPIFA